MSRARLFKTTSEHALPLINSLFNETQAVVDEFFLHQLKFCQDMKHLVTVIKKSDFITSAKIDHKSLDYYIQPYEQLLESPLTSKPKSLSKAILLLTDTIHEKNNTFLKIIEQIDICIKRFPAFMIFIQQIKQNNMEVFQKLSNALEKHVDLLQPCNPNVIRSELIKPFQSFMKIPLFLKRLQDSLPPAEKFPDVTTWKKSLQASDAFIALKADQLNAAQSETSQSQDEKSESSEKSEKLVRKKSFFGERKSKAKSIKINETDSSETFSKLRKTKSE